MSATNTPNQGFPLVQLSDSPAQLAAAFAALAAAADAKVNQLDADQARAISPSMVKISCSLGYLCANDTASPLIGMQFDTVEVNRGTPTDLSVFNGLLINRGLWMVGYEATMTPNSSIRGNGNDIQPSVKLFTGSSDPVNGFGYTGFDLSTTIQTVGMPNFTTPVTWAQPRQYVNGCTLALAPSDGFVVQVQGQTFIDVNYATLWAVQLGDL